jgi:signal transduction histidine kinase
MNRLIADLLDVASIDAGRLAVNAQHGDLVAMLAEAVEAFESAAASKDTTITLLTPDGPLPAEFDHARLFQVMGNLLMNSIKFTARGGRITVRGERTGESWLCSVTDTGVGIPSDRLELVFDRYAQAGSNRTGLGLGLFISKCIVEAHGGRIWAESTMGAGSRVSFSLPLAHGERQPPMSGDEAP